MLGNTVTLCEYVHRKILSVQVIDNRARRWLFTYEPFPAIEISLRKQLQEEDSKWIVTHRVRIFLP